MNIDPIIPKRDLLRAVPFSEATLWREQRAGRFPKFENISARRVGLRLSDYNQWLEGRREWGSAA